MYSRHVCAPGVPGRERARPSVQLRGQAGGADRGLRRVAVCVCTVGANVCASAWLGAELGEVGVGHEGARPISCVRAVAFQCRLPRLCE